MIYLVRHTKVSVPCGVCYGQKDVLPAESFEDELCIIKDNLSHVNPLRIYTSPLQRCVKLAERLCHDGMSPISDNRLMEMNFGHWEGKFWNDIYKDDYARLWFSSYDTLRCPDGESFKDMLDRVSDFKNSLISKNEDILVVTHAGVIRCFKILTEGISIKESFNIEIDYGQIFKIENK